MTTYRLLAALCAAAVPLFASANDGASPTDAQERLKSLVATIKSSGGPAAAKSVMGADDPAKCKFKDLVCLVADVKTSTLLAHTAIPKLAGSPLTDDMLDVDGVSINQQLFGPAKQGKVKWESKYKFSRPDTKKIVGRAAFCEKVGDAHVACVSVSN